MKHRHHNKKTPRNFRRSRPERRRRDRQEATGVFFQGSLTVSMGGFGFVTPEAKYREQIKSDVFIPPRFMTDAMDGDKVKVELLPERAQDRAANLGPAGKIVAIIEKAHEEIVGEMLAGRRVKPLNRRLGDNINISGSLNGVKRGQWVKVKLLPRSDGEMRGVISKGMDEAGSLKSDLDAVCEEYKLPGPYSEAENLESETLQPREITRRDLTDLFCVTIDPHDAKDFDDAVSLQDTEDANIMELGVHIADVAAWIKPRSKFDAMAAERAFTAYLPGRTLPMLPKNLTRSISLTPDAESLAHSVIFKIHAESGRIISSERFHSVIRINARLNFDQVQEFIAGGKCPDAWNDEFKQRMNQLAKITANMRKRRRQNEEFIDLAIGETRVLCDEENDKIIGIEKRLQGEADQLIEECMLAANSAVATELAETHLPGLFRIHDEPDVAKLEEFSAFVSSTFGFFPGDLTSRSVCNEFLDSIDTDPGRKAIILNHFLRAMPRACYSEQCSMHFGLGKGRYSHFTSPIRRYADLAVHQQLWAKENNEKLRSNIDMEKVAEACSNKEERNDNAYFAANDRIKLRYLDEQLAGRSGEVHEAMIAKVSSSGMVVDLLELGMSGFVPMDMLGGRYRFNKSENALIPARGHEKYTCGDYIYLLLSHIDHINGVAVFAPAK